MLGTPMNSMPANRWQAFGVHLGLSFLIFVMLTAIIALIWFPGPFISVGGWHGLSIVFAVDMVLGPTLTLIVYNVQKKSLKMDLAIIAAIQISCLGAGLFQVYKERPVAQVFTDQGVSIVTAAEFKGAEIDFDFLADYSGSYPKAIHLGLPTEPVKLVNTRMMATLQNETALELITERYQALATISDNDWNWFVDEMDDHKREENCVWMPISSTHAEGYACVNKSVGITKLANDIP